MATSILRNSNAFGKTAQNTLLFDHQLPSTDINLLEKRIKTEVFQKRIRVRDTFFDFDRLRKGFVTIDKFKTALSMLNIFLSDLDIQALIQKYHIKEDLVDYSEFCKNVDQVFADLDQTREALIKQVDKEIHHEIPDILNSIKSIIRTKRILVKQPFQDFDRTKSSTVSQSHFVRVLRQLGLLPNERVLQLLLTHYNQNGLVNYVKFCDDVDNVQEMIQQTSTQQQNHQTQGHGQSKREIDLQNNEDNLVNDVRQINISQTYLSSQILPGCQTVDDIIKKIQALVVMKQIRINEFFKDFDTLRKGTVSSSQFRRILNIENISLNDKEYNLLLSKYQLPSGLFNYYDFCEDVNRVFTQKGIEKDPLYRVQQIDKSTTIPARRNHLDFTEEERKELENILLLYRIEIQNRRVLCKPHFEDFDKVKQGYISKSQFQRILHQFGLYPDERSLSLILRKYIDKGNLNEVNYYSFCRDVDIFEDGLEISKKHAEQFQNYQKSDGNNMFQTILNDVPNDLQDLLAKLRKRLQEKRIRIREFLRDFDKLRTGTITVNQLRQGLAMAQLQLSNQEFELLIKEFSNQEKLNYINWRELCDQVDEQSVIKDMEKKSSALEIQTPSTNFSYGRQQMTEREVQQAEMIKRRFTNFCKATRLDIKQFFQDWDRQGRNKITQKQFRQVLATVNFNLSEQEYDVLLKMYAAENELDVRYVDFVKDTLPPPFEIQNIIKSKSQAQSNEGYQQNFNNTINTTSNLQQTQQNVQNDDYVDPDVLLNKIKKEVMVNQLRVGEYQKDYDPLRKGLLPKNKFRGILSAMKVYLTEQELNTAELMYQSYDDETKVDFQRFLDDVNVVFTQSHLEKDPLVKPQKFNPPLFLDPKDALTPEEEEQFHLLMLRLGEVVRKHRILLKPHFMDKDRAKSGKVSFNRFRSILDFHKLPLTESQFKLLCKRFAFQRTEFNYVEFVELIKQYEQEFE